MFLYSKSGPRRKKQKKKTDLLDRFDCKTVIKLVLIEPLIK